jgi:hypothetical protein
MLGNVRVLLAARYQLIDLFASIGPGGPAHHRTDRGACGKPSQITFHRRALIAQGFFHLGERFCGALQRDQIGQLSLNYARCQIQLSRAVELDFWRPVESAQNKCRSGFRLLVL